MRAKCGSRLRHVVVFVWWVAAFGVVEGVDAGLAVVEVGGGSHWVWPRLVVWVVQPLSARRLWMPQARARLVMWVLWQVCQAVR